MVRKQAISAEQRLELRRWVQEQHPKPTQRACIQWFHERYHRLLSQSSISESLSSTFDSLKPADAPQRRQRVGRWPELEKILDQWQKRIDSKGGFTSGDILIEKAKQIWNKLPQCNSEPCPEFSSGWLERFKKRHNIKQHIRHGEAASVPAGAEDEMRAIRTLAGSYEEKDIYNMDETGLFWKMMPARGLSSISLPGVKKDKTRITLVFCVNADGSDRFPIWFIGKAREPRALRNINVRAMGGEWRWNSKAWMNTELMGQWLRAFYAHIGARTVLLSMDNFSAHNSALELFPPPPNVRIAWLPPNSTSRFQPLDQGIIQCFKAHYRRQWLSFMLDCFDSERDPLKSMDIHLAIRWSIRCWNDDVQNTTIYNCFRKSTLTTTPIDLPNPIDPPNLSELYSRVARAGNIQNAMAIDNFLNPEEEAEEVRQNEELDQEEILQEILQQNGLVQPPEDEDEEEAVAKPAPTAQAVKEALELIVDYAERQEEIEQSDLRALDRLDSKFRRLWDKSLVQSNLDRWFN